MKNETEKFFEICAQWNEGKGNNFIQLLLPGFHVHVITGITQGMCVAEVTRISANLVG